MIASKVQAPTSAAAMVRLVIVNINAVLVLHLILGVPLPTLAPAPVHINMPAPAQVTPEAWAQLAEASIHRVLVPANIVGMAVLVRPVAAVINTLVKG